MFLRTTLSPTPTPARPPPRTSTTLQAILYHAVAYIVICISLSLLCALFAEAILAFGSLPVIGFIAGGVTGSALTCRYWDEMEYYLGLDVVEDD
jgi:hypothetical protein